LRPEKPRIHVGAQQHAGIAELRAKAADRTYVIVIDTDAHQWTPGDAWWDVGVPEVSRRKQVQEARAAQAEGRHKQRIGV